MLRSVQVLLLISILGAGPVSAKEVPRIGPNQAQALIQKREVLLLDVRTDAEYQEVRIPGTDVLIPVQDLASRIKELEPSMNRPILVYCRSGNRSLQAAELLKQHGFRDVTDLEGGILAWSAKGLPTESGPN